MSALQLILSPLISLMQVVLEILHAAVNSYGFAIVLLSLVVRLATTPITRMASRLEEAERAKLLEMAPALAAAKAQLKGRERFERIDEIYQKHDYHPIRSLASIVPLLLQIPFLLAALFLLIDYPPLAGQPFGFIPDLSRPDGLLRIGSAISINVVPLALTAIALLDSAVRIKTTRQSRIKFLIVSLVLVVLIYPLPAGVCIYWLSSNVFSLTGSGIERLRSGESSE